MEVNKKLHSIVLVSVALILFLIVISSAESAQTESEITSEAGNTSDEQVLLDEIPTEGNSLESIQAVTPKIIETLIPTNKSEKRNLVIYGNRIVWIDLPIDANTTSIHIYDLSTKKETQIPTSGNAEHLAIHGNRIVYADSRSGNGTDIYMYDLSTEKETRITSDPSIQWDPAIHGDRIVWYDNRNGNYDIYMYNLSTSTETQITTDMSDQWGPAIYGDRIVWDDFRNGKRHENPDIYMYDLSTKKETQITTSRHAEEPDIYGNRIVYRDGRAGLQIYMYNLSTSEETRISTNKSWKDCPLIYGDRIVWQDWRNKNYDIYMYDLFTSNEIQITTNSSDQSVQSIYGDTIVWLGPYNYGARDIYMATLSSKLPVAAFSASPISGKAPLTVAFTDKSKGTPTKWKWNFGDGATSSKQNPIHKYSNVGTYTVKLTAINAEGNNTATKNGYIQVIAKPAAIFSAEPTSGKAPLTVSFTDKSTGTPIKWRWTFGDGKTSTDQNPKHEYLQEGNYKVTLTVSNAAGSSTATKTNYIKVTTNTRPGIYSENK